MSDATRLLFSDCGTLTERVRDFVRANEAEARSAGTELKDALAQNTANTLIGVGSALRCWTNIEQSERIDAMEILKGSLVTMGHPELVDGHVIPKLDKINGSNLAKMAWMTAAGETNTYWWNDSAEGLEEAMWQGASGCTTNPVIIWNAIKGNPDKWTLVRDGIWKKDPKATVQMVGDAMTMEVVVENAKMLEPIWKATGGQFGVVSFQLAPIYSHDSEKMYGQACDVSNALSDMGVGNIVFKVPGTRAGLDVCDSIMRDTLMGINVTVNYSRAQQWDFAEKIEAVGLDQASYLTQMNGRANEVFRDELKSLGVADYNEVQKWGMHIIRMACYTELYLQMGFRRSRPLGAAGRGPWDIHGAMMNGPVPSVVTIFPPRQEEFDAEVRELDPCGMMAAVPEGYFDTLMECRSFRDYFELGRITPDEYNGLPSTIATLNQFCDDYLAFLAWIEEGKPA